MTMEKNNVKNFFDNFASKTFITILGIVAASITIYAFLQKTSVNLCYEITSNTNVLDFNADISKLEVTYDSTNLKQTNENLRIYTVKVINNGNKDILKEFYDENDPVGLKISTGKIIEAPEIIQTSSDYLKRNAKVIDYNVEEVIFSQVILESGEFFTVKLLLLHKQDTIPELLPFGKVAGQKMIEIINSINIKKEYTFLGRVYRGNIWVQLLRILSYLTFVILLILVIVWISDKVDSRKERKRKEKMIRNFKSTGNYRYTRMDDAIFDRYQKQDAVPFKQMQELIKDEKELNEVYKLLKEKIKKTGKVRETKGIKVYQTLPYITEGKWATITYMINDGIVFKEKEVLRINQAMKETLHMFIMFLDKNGEFKKHLDFIDDYTEEINSEEIDDI